MKNKGLVYLLGALVVVVWGLIIYRVFGAMAGSDDVMPSTVSSPIKAAYNDYSQPKDTSKLRLNYRNPFGREEKKDTVPVVKRSIIKPVAVNPAQAINWGFIKYSGYVRNPGSKKLIAIVIINGKNTMLQDGEIQDRVKLIKNMGDSIKVSFNGATKFIKLDNSSL